MESEGSRRTLTPASPARPAGAEAVFHALEPLRPESQRQVVLVTDGYIGFESEVVGEMLSRLPAGARLHTVGVGAAPNRALTSRTARAGRGVEVLASDKARAEEAAAKLVRGTAAPVLTDVVVEGSAVVGAAPARPRDVLAGQPLVVAIELSAQGLILQGRAHHDAHDG